MATYIPAPYDPMQQAIMSLGAALGQRIGDTTLPNLLGGYTKADKQRMDNQNMLDMLALQDPTSEAAQMAARRRFEAGQQLLPGMSYQGETGTQMPQMNTPQGQAMMQQYLLGQMLNPLQRAQTQATVSGTRRAEQVLPVEIEGQQARTRYNEALTKQVGKPTPMNEYQTALALESKKRTQLMGKMTPSQRRQFRLAEQDQLIDKDYKKALTETAKGRAAYYKAQAQGSKYVDRTEFERLITGLPKEQQKSAILVKLGLEPGNAAVRQMPMTLLQELQEVRDTYMSERDKKGFTLGRLQNILYSQDPKFENFRTQIDAFFEGLQLEEPQTR